MKHSQRGNSNENLIKEDEPEISLLEERLSEYKANPNQTETWAEFKDRMIKKIDS